MFETLDATRGKLPRIPTPPRKGGNPQAKAWELEREGSQAKAWELERVDPQAKAWKSAPWFTKLELGKTL